MLPVHRRHACLAAPPANTCSRNNPQNKRQQRPAPSVSFPSSGSVKKSPVRERENSRHGGRSGCEADDFAFLIACTHISPHDAHIFSPQFPFTPAPATAETDYASAPASVPNAPPPSSQTTASFANRNASCCLSHAPLASASVAPNSRAPPTNHATNPPPPAPRPSNPHADSDDAPSGAARPGNPPSTLAPLPRPASPRSPPSAIIRRGRWPHDRSISRTFSSPNPRSPPRSVAHTHNTAPLSAQQPA